MPIADALASSTGKSAKFPTVGATITGTVISADVVQARNFDTGDPEFWADGSPKQQFRITLTTDLRDPSDGGDDGTRSVYVKAWGDGKKELQRAVKASGAADILTGGTFTATYTGDGELPAGKRGFPPKVYRYEYVAPSATAAALTTLERLEALPDPAPAGQTLPMTPEVLAALAAAGVTLPAA